MTTDRPQPRQERTRRTQLLRKLRESRPAEGTGTTGGAGAPGPGRTEAPASYGQEGLWFIDQFDPDSTQYTIPMAFRLRGALVLDALRHALGDAVARHAALRTLFVDDDGAPRQRHAAPGPVPLPVEDLSALPAESREDELLRRLEAESRRTFDLAEGPLFVAGLLKLAEDDHVLLMNVHHIVFDGWSLGVLVEELSVLYGDRAHGRATSLEPLPLQYTDYAVWERDWLRGEESRAQYDYWAQRLDGVPRLELPTDRPRPAVASTEGASLSFTLDREVRDALVRISAEEQVTPFMVVLAAFHLVLARAGGQQDFAVGTPIANRPLPGTQQLVGYFVNSVVLRTDLSGVTTFRDVLARVRDVVLGGFENQNYPFAQLVARLDTARDPVRSPFFQAYFVMRDESWDRLDWPDLTVESVELPVTSSVFDVTLVAKLSAQGVEGELNFRSDLFAVERMDRLVEEFGTVLGRALNAPDSETAHLF
ncbi:condensation domain-containing protein [Streptomyces diastaticus]|uniref:condensation domain-containing protein n=1 Tax=Streptomyces diastaticus TaxID=1956 RepID=UPI00340130E6